MSNVTNHENISASTNLQQTFPSGLPRMNETTRAIRYALFELWLAECRPPTTSELAARTGESTSTVTKSLQELDELHHIKIYGKGTPSTVPIAMAHPFSHLPTPYVVCQGSKSWWANCAWCGFGLAAMLSTEQNSVHVLLASGKYREFKIVNCEIDPTGHIADYHVTFSPDPSTWWDDVRYTCSSIQVHESKEDAENWFDQRGFARGDVLDLQTVWKLSKAWYGDKASYDYNRKTREEAQALFKQLGMVAPYWQK